MSKVHPKSVAKPSKPFPEFPLFAHATGRWAKKIRGKLHYFGKWADPDAALDTYMAQKDALHSGRAPRANPDALTIKDIANEFLNYKAQRRDAGELSPHTWDGYKEAADFLVKHLGKTRLVSDLAPTDFTTLRNKMSKRWGPHHLSVVIQSIRSMFKHAFESEMIDTPARFGPAFKRPTKKTFRLHRAKQGTKLFTAEEIKAMLKSAGPQLKAMILLGINCGFGNSDCGNLPTSALDLENKTINFPRPKTGVDRRCPLWPETVQALRDVLDKRSKRKIAKELARLVFITRYGGPWFRNKSDNPISKECRKLLNSLGLNGHRSFYTLRHTFRTIADETKDQVACDFIMGHAKDDMASQYRERIEDDRLIAVTDHVHKWLFGETRSEY